MVFYLKYRPKNIKELDSDSLRQKLESVLSGKLPENIPHAFLFTGPKGLGKTSTARILAKAINCTNRKDAEIEPCNKCDSCKTITNGTNLDVLEIDAASNRGIDEIRDLREKIRLSPLGAKKKVYIIDEVHMLTTEAFNALLKTLEEPPSHAVFILCTTEPQKVPETILSRCVNIKFSKATDEDLLRSFQRIVKGENMKADKDALLKIASLSDGSFRDGVKILEEVSGGKSSITLDLIEGKYKTKTITGYVESLIDSLVNKDAKAGIKIISALSREGVDFKFFTEALIAKVHQDLLNLVEGGKGKLSIDESKSLIEKLVMSHMSVKYAVLPELPLELLIVEWSFEKSHVPSEDTITPISKQKDEPSLKPTQQKPSGKSAEHDKILEDLIEALKKDNFSIAGVLRGCKVEKFDKGELILSTGFKFHRERLNDPKIITLIENLLLKINGREIKFSVKLN